MCGFIKGKRDTFCQQTCQYDPMRWVKATPIVCTLVVIIFYDGLSCASASASTNASAGASASSSKSAAQILFSLFESLFKEF